MIISIIIICKNLWRRKGGQKSLLIYELVRESLLHDFALVAYFR
jgi:hypothetical protein